MNRTCAVVPFPQARRRRFIAKTALRLASLSTKTAEKLLAATLQQQASAMARKGIPCQLIEGERCNLGSAIRAELWRRVLLSDDAA
jgi:hypothetical protein